MYLTYRGWLKKYVLFRLEQPFVLWESELPPIYRVNADHDPDIHMSMDRILYQTFRTSGVLFGCPILDVETFSQFSNIKYLNRHEKANFIYLETLFKSLFQEIVFLAPQIGHYEDYLARTTLRVIQYFLRHDLDDRFFKLKLGELLVDEGFHELLVETEKELLRRFKIKTRMSFANSLRNNFAFLDIYFLIHWNRRFNNHEKAPIDYLEEIEEDHHQLQRQLILIFASLLWRSEINKRTPKDWVPRLKYRLHHTKIRYRALHLLSIYTLASSLPKEEKREMLRRIQHPITLVEVPFRVTEPIINKYMMEQTLLLSLVEKKPTPWRHPFIRELRKRLQMDELDVEASESSVVEFFQLHGQRFDFLRGNRAMHHLQDHLQEHITVLIQKNRNSLMNEIRQTQRLYNLLVKASEQPLNPEEKRFVRTQLLSVAKTVPALAIFILPAGSVILPLVIKVLPFNILPDSFAE